MLPGMDDAQFVGGMARIFWYNIRQILKGKRKKA